VRLCLAHDLQTRANNYTHAPTPVLSLSLFVVPLPLSLISQALAGNDDIDDKIHHHFMDQIESRHLRESLQVLLDPSGTTGWLRLVGTLQL